MLGPSGAGKSTLLRVVAGLEPATARPVVIAGRDVTAAAPGPAQRVDGVPVVRAVPAPDRRREHRVRARWCATRRAARRRERARGGRRRGRLRAPARPAARRSSPAASGSGWRWPGRWSASPTCSCSTSRCPTWTSSCGWRRGPSCKALHDRVGAHHGARHPRPDRGAGARRPDRGAARRARSSRSARRTRSGARPATTFVARFVGSPADEPAAGRRPGPAARRTVRPIRRGPADRVPARGGAARRRRRRATGVVERVDVVGEDALRVPVRVGGQLGRRRGYRAADRPAVGDQVRVARRWADVHVFDAATGRRVGRRERRAATDASGASSR